MDPRVGEGGAGQEWRRPAHYASFLPLEGSVVLSAKRSGGHAGTATDQEGSSRIGTSYFLRNPLARNTPFLVQAGKVVLPPLLSCWPPSPPRARQATLLPLSVAEPVASGSLSFWASFLTWELGTFDPTSGVVWQSGIPEPSLAHFGDT